MPIHMYPIITYTTDGPRADLLVLGQDLESDIEVLFSSRKADDEADHHFPLLSSKDLDIMLMGPKLARPGKLTWHAKCPQDPALDIWATITFGEQDLRS